MKFPINEEEKVNEFKVHMESKDLQMTESDEQFERMVVRLLNSAYVVGVQDGLERNC